MAFPATSAVVRFWSMSVQAEPGTVWQLVLTGLAPAIGLGAPLVKVRVVAEDGSTSSRRRDELEAALAGERLAAEEALGEVRELPDDAARAHDDYPARLRPTVVHAAGASMVQAENALGLLTVLLGRGGTVARRDPVGPDPPTTSRRCGGPSRGPRR